MNKKKSFILYIAVLSIHCLINTAINAQENSNTSFMEKTHLGLGVGMSQLGGEGSFKYRKYPSFEAFLDHEITNKFSIKGRFFYTNVGGSSGLNYLPAQSGESVGKIVNLSSDAELASEVLPYNFKSRIFELSILPQFNLFDITEGGRITPYIYSGITFYHFNRYFLFPSGYVDPTTGKVKKQEPGGIYLPAGTSVSGSNGRANSSTLLNIPFGIGIKYSVTKFIGIYGEFSRRILFTDYIDGYGSTELFKNNSNDYYYTLTIGMYFRLGGFETSLFKKKGNNWMNDSKGKSSIRKGCPPVYL